METLRSYEALRAKLRVLPKPCVVAIEGFCGSGKSHLADQLGRDVPALVFHIDDFATKHENPPPYLDCLRLPELIDVHTRWDRVTPWIVEGICLREVLAACAIDASLFIYIKRLSANGRLWHDGFHLENFEAESAIELEPHLSDLKYHSRVRPHERADITYLRVEADGDV